MILPYFFPSTFIRAKAAGQKATKASKLEVREKFIDYFESLQEADDNEMKLLKENTEIQPRCVFVGKFDNLKAYVFLWGKIYFFDDPLEAVEKCFHTYHALNIKYPRESLIVWTFLQVNIFNVTTKNDIHTSSMSTVWHSLST